MEKEKKRQESKWSHCSICNLRIRANGHNPEEREENHKKGFHCNTASSKSRRR